MVNVKACGKVCNPNEVNCEYCTGKAFETMTEDEYDAFTDCMREAGFDACDDGACMAGIWKLWSQTYSNWQDWQDNLKQFGAFSPNLPPFPGPGWC